MMTGDEIGAAFFQEIFPSGVATSERDAPPAMKTLSLLDIMEVGVGCVERAFVGDGDAFFAAGEENGSARFGE